MTVLDQRVNDTSGSSFSAKDPISAATHFAGAIAAVLGMPLLLIRAAAYGASQGQMISYAVFMMSMIILYSASASYHTFRVQGKAARVLKKIDHCSIFLLIAGSYTPIAVNALPSATGKVVLTAVWIVAIAGIAFKSILVYVPKWGSSVMYIGMGWICIPFLPAIVSSLSRGAFLWLLAGGIFYSIGGVIYSVKKDLLGLQSKGFGNHELFHIFVLAGSFCHFICIFCFICTAL